ncbi:site-specific integrase [Pantoea sp. EABMAA-21]|uniref:site-specific integrase n=1 Tax=Pantoea sp. EABMAA-21 TaxID=3043302 RepID=UPI0024B5B958|nr:site-specific integrase [Pantoea sp. EABMAA-21]MDI9276294.1 site-specific integrase [Pantoea sp. EABMAA-21]
MNKLKFMNAHQDIFHAKNDGYTFGLDDEFWELSRNIKLNVGEVTEKLSDNLRYGYVNTLKYFAEEISPGSVKEINRVFFKLISVMSFDSFDEAVMLTTKSNDKFSNQDLSCLRILIKKWYELGFKGVTKSCVDLVDNWTIKDNKKGEVVKRRDPHQGPLTDMEFDNFYDAVSRAYHKGTISYSDLAMALIIIHTGRRSLQITQIKTKDIIKERTINECYIDIPRIKQGEKYRASFRRFRITGELFNIFKEQSRLVSENFSKQLGRKLSDKEILELPLFFCQERLEGVVDCENLHAILSSDRLHAYAVKCTQTLKRIAITENVVSERTGKVINMNARRFRYTLGTRLAREGYGEVVIGELLDHSTLMYTGVYVQSGPESLIKIEEAVSVELGYYAKMFQGELINKSEDKYPGGNIRINTGEKSGQCASCKSCTACVPIPCYTCMHFRPFVEGPHEKLLEYLLDERRRIQCIVDDPATTQILDRTIIAVSEVIKKCKEFKSNPEVLNG